MLRTSSNSSQQNYVNYAPSRLTKKVMGELQDRFSLARVAERDVCYGDLIAAALSKSSGTYMISTRLDRNVQSGYALDRQTW